MAETKTTPRKKATPRAKVEETKVVETEETVEDIQEEVVEKVEVKAEPIIEKKTTEERKKSVNIDLHEMIPVRSVTKGGLSYKSPKTGLLVRWNDYGSEEYLEFGEIMTMKSSKPKFLTEPYIVIDDEQVVEKLGLKELYANLEAVGNIETLFRDDVKTMEDKIAKMPKGIKKLAGDKSREMIQNGELYDIRKIKLLESKLNIDLQILMD